MSWVLGAIALLILGAGLVVHIWPHAVARTLIRATRLFVGLAKKEIAVPGFRIAYLEGGRGKPLILLHGLGADKDNFLLVARDLRRQFRVIIPDLPGFGESDKPQDRSYTISEQVERIHEFSRALGIERFHLAGNSMGGFIAAAYAARYPDDLDSLWLLAPAGVRSARSSELLETIAQGDEAQILARSPQEMRAVVSFVFHRRVYLPRFLAVYQAEQSRRNFGLHKSIIKQLLKGKWLDELLHHPIQVPTLIMWGDRDRAVHVSGAEVLRGLLPNSQVAVLKDVGHIPMLEAPRRTVAEYRRFHAGLRKRRPRSSAATRESH